MNIIAKKLTFTQTVEVDAQRIKDLLTSGFEGGCNYWLVVKAAECKVEAEKLDGELNIENQILKGGTLHIWDVEDFNHKLGILTYVRIVEALQAMANGEDLMEKKNDHLKWHFNNFITENDDAETADVVIQIATMGQIVYG